MDEDWHPDFHADRADWLAIAGIALAAALARLAFSLWLPPLIHLDSDSYFEIAQRLSATNEFGDLTRRPPLYPLILWLTGLAPQIGLWGAIIGQHLAGTLTAVLFYLLPRRMFFPRFRGAAILSGLLCALVPAPIILGHSILSEPLYTLLIALAGWTALGWLRQGRLTSAVWCGALLALAAMTRPIAMGLFPLWAVLLFFLQSRRSALRFFLVAGGAFVLILIPLLVRNHVAWDRVAITQSLGRNIISVADRFIDYDRDPHRLIRATYKPFLAGKRGPDAVVIYAALPELRRATQLSDIEIDRALAAIAREAILDHPFEFLRSRLARYPLMLRDPATGQWQWLRHSTYLPLLEFAGRRNPELAARSLRGADIDPANFERAHSLYRVLSAPLTGTWYFALVLLGMAAMICGRRLGLQPTGAVLWIALFFHHTLGTVLLQPPNIRYRIPALPWEILFAAVGLALVVTALLKGLRTKWNRPLTVPPAILVIIVFSAVAAIFSVRATVLSRNEVAIRVNDLKVAGDEAEGPSAASDLLRQIHIAGQPLSVLYWDGGTGHATRLSAEVPVSAGGPVHLRAAYSCQTARCAGSVLRLQLLDGNRQPLLSRQWPLAQERADNDLFWDQLEERLKVPAGSATLLLEFRFPPEPDGSQNAGRLVIPHLTVRTRTPRREESD